MYLFEIFLIICINNEITVVILTVLIFNKDLSVNPYNDNKTDLLSVNKDLHWNDFCWYENQQKFKLFVRKHQIEEYLALL